MSVGGDSQFLKQPQGAETPSYSGQHKTNCSLQYGAAAGGSEGWLTNNANQCDLCRYEKSSPSWLTTSQTGTKVTSAKNRGQKSSNIWAAFGDF